MGRGGKQEINETMNMKQVEWQVGDAGIFTIS